MSVTYSSYLKIDELLSLQKPLSEGPEHDETLFIVIHQVYELWFKQTLHELDRLSGLFLGLIDVGDESDRHANILLAQRRALTILKTMVAQIDILETITPISFNSFRERLEAASGFQSPQFRELEFLLGLRNRGMLVHHHANRPAMKRLERRLAEPSLYQAFLAYVMQNGYEIPDDAFELSDKPIAMPEVRETLIEVYRTNHGLIQVCERLIDYDEGVQEWRYRHVKMVERTIGSKKGTGGSPGAEYLRSTLFRPAFPDLWAIRSEL